MDTLNLQLKTVEHLHRSYSDAFDLFVADWKLGVVYSQIYDFNIQWPAGCSDLHTFTVMNK